ncbi:nicotinate-nucleotide--dimethylbenzimidazole phosphoribosyltransferase [Dyadobacter sp. CY343]|uniref:nicotinate-nucleotide--dimethylbenzimidazole phosphoribosyltransferase n=1 Tax=Dyadobacter sp. CY343 TaxID=2907299 RepID=UPI001F2A489B|nr:nicotinate-nucleotide--dimethylbenzimidazole phosphoribosyltransferase [Dyadobacter sp. CY343]MCE7059168.1 nicotinate-nucleotide--dimethylbenzimidazole phosphoribosyltransferase [Dyadobacter sp. CY343]
MSQTDFEVQIQQKIDSKTKPAGSLGMLEHIAFQIARVQQTLSPELIKPHIVVFAGSHGIAREGVSAYPAEVTAQMVLNFLTGGAAINVFARQQGIELVIVDAGVDFVFENDKKLVNAKVGAGTRSFLSAEAMTAEQCAECFDKGAYIVQNIRKTGCNVIGFGEMGIGNTSSAAVIMSKLLGLPIADCVGKGTGLDAMQLENKLSVLQNALTFHAHVGNDPLQVLQTFGGFEIAMMCGAMLEAYRQNMIVLVDGFIASVAFLAAFKMNDKILDNAIFCHQSDEKGQKLLLQKLHANPVLQLNMRLGEGTGCAVAYPLIMSAVAFFNKMASFDSAQVSQKTTS